MILVQKMKVTQSNIVPSLIIKQRRLVYYCLLYTSSVPSVSQWQVVETHPFISVRAQTTIQNIYLLYIYTEYIYIIYIYTEYLLQNKRGHTVWTKLILKSILYGPKIRGGSKRRRISFPPPPHCEQCTITTEWKAPVFFNMHFQKKKNSVISSDHSWPGS